MVYFIIRLYFIQTIMLTSIDIKCILLERYLNLKKGNAIKQNELLSLYVQIMEMTYDLIEEYGFEKVKSNFIELFEEEIIYFDKEDQVRFLINQNLLENIIETNQVLQKNIKLQTIDEELPNQVEDIDVENSVETIPEEVEESANQLEDINVENIVQTMTEEFEEIKENIANTAGIIHEEVDHLVTTTVAQVDRIKSSSFAKKAKKKFKQLQGNLSQCFGGGKTSI